MSFNINKFRSSFEKEPQAVNKFDCIIIPPVSLLPAAAITAAQKVRYRIKSASLPGKSLQGFDYQTNNVGPTIKIVNGSFYEPVQLEVIMSQQGLERMFFQTWVDFINPTQIYNHTVRYFDRYTGSMLINAYGSDGKLSTITALTNCFPLTMTSVDLSWDSDNQIATFRVEMSYERYITFAPGAISSAALPSFGNPIPSLGAGLDALGAFADLVPFPEVDITGLVSKAADLL